MKITNTPANYINQSYNSHLPNSPAQNTKNAVGGEESVQASDSIRLSSRTQTLQKISKAAEISSPEREKYVADIKQQVESNQYNVNVEAVAEKMAGTLMDQFV